MILHIETHVKAPTRQQVVDYLTSHGWSPNGRSLGPRGDDWTRPASPWRLAHVTVFDDSHLNTENCRMMEIDQIALGEGRSPTEVYSDIMGSKLPGWFKSLNRRAKMGA